MWRRNNHLLIFSNSATFIIHLFHNNYTAATVDYCDMIVSGDYGTTWAETKGTKYSRGYIVLCCVEDDIPIIGQVTHAALGYYLI